MDYARLFVDDTIHAATSDELRDQFIREYREDFDINLEDVLSTFLGMEIEHNKENLAIHLDKYIQETLAEYKAAVTMILKPTQVPMKLGICWSLNTVQRALIMRGRSFTDRLRRSSNLQQHGYNVILRSLHHSWHDSVLPQVHCTGWHCTT